MHIAIPKETARGERRVAIVPETVARLRAKGFTFDVQAGAGEAAGFSDDDYRQAGAQVVATPKGAVISVTAREDASISLLYPHANPAFVRAQAAAGLTSIALDLIPRTTLAQSMDVLSSQANFAGYWAVIAAAARLPKIFPMLMTAAGTVAPARVLIMGAGVAGLSAIGTARRLGGVVEATDVRPETKEQVESLGAKFVEVTGVEVKHGSGGYAAEQSEDYKRRQAEVVAAAIARADVVITTALVPGRRAPQLVSDALVKSMRLGSVIVDLAAEQGGNVEGSVAGEDVVVGGVTIVGALSAPSHVAYHASQAFSRNVEKLLLHLTKDGAWALGTLDDIARGCVIVKDGTIIHPQFAALGAA